MKKKCNENLRLLRRSFDYSQEYVASFLSISQKTYSNIEQGKIKAKPDLILKLSEILKVSSGSIIQTSCDCDCIFKDKHSQLVKYLIEQNITIPKKLL